MPWNHRLLALTATPASVRMARDWVVQVFDEIGRPELADSARLAVSELVTNAILHAEPPVTVRVRGTVDNPRVEVSDHSMIPPQRRQPTDLITFGRGLDLVASHSRTWGSDIVTDNGKVVWFEPSATPHPPVDGKIFDIDAALAELGEVAAEPDGMVTIRLLGMPVRLFSRLRLHFAECGREVRLLALADPDRYPLEAELAMTCLQIEHERRLVSGIEQLDKAMVEGCDVIDLDYIAPSTAPATMAQLARQLDALYRRYDDEPLLTVRPSPLLLRLQRWYLSEFSRQSAGEPPIRWVGPLDLPGGVEL